MAKVEHIRETLQGPLDVEYFQQKARAGWHLVAAEWEREAPGTAESSERFEEVPYGLQVAGDCQHLKENEQEMQILTLMMRLMIEEIPLSQVAAELNRRGFRTRQGSPWNPVAVFNLLPRLIEVGPRIFPGNQWQAFRRQWSTSPALHS